MVLETVMRTHPDGLEVVETWEKTAMRSDLAAATLKTPPLLVLGGVGAFLDAHGPGSGRCHGLGWATGSPT